MNQYSLPTLPYSFTALEPYIDSRTMELHYTKHHQAYVDKLNAAISSEPTVQNSPLEKLLQNLDSVPESIRQAVRNHGGGPINHSHYWSILTPQATKPQGQLEEHLKAAFSSPDGFLQKFKEAGLSHFGSGWVWLVSDNSKLNIVTTPNQDSPISQGLTPLLGIDLWEHSYYLKYQNRRADYLDAIFHIINWNQVQNNYQSNQ